MILVRQQRRPTRRGKARPARGCPAPAASRPRPTKPRRPGSSPDDRHACRIAKLRVKKNALAKQLYHINKLLDAELIAARRDKTLYAVIGQAVQLAEDRPQTADDLKRVERQLRKATQKALHRRDPGGDKAVVARAAKQHETGVMTHDPYLRRRIIEEYGPPPGELSPEELGTPPAPTLVGGDLGDPDDDDLDDDGDLGDAEQDDDLDDEEDQS